MLVECQGGHLKDSRVPCGITGILRKDPKVPCGRTSILRNLEIVSFYSNLESVHWRRKMAGLAEVRETAVWPAVSSGSFPSSAAAMSSEARSLLPAAEMTAVPSKPLVFRATAAIPPPPTEACVGLGTQSLSQKAFSSRAFVETFRGPC